MVDALASGASDPCGRGSSSLLSGTLAGCYFPLFRISNITCLTVAANQKIGVYQDVTPQAHTVFGNITKIEFIFFLRYILPKSKRDKIVLQVKAPIVGFYLSMPRPWRHKWSVRTKRNTEYI